MTDGSQNSIESFELRMRLDCTLRVNDSDWFKPGVEGAVRWKRLPDDQDLKDAASYLQFGVIDPTITDALAHIMERMKGELPKRGL